EEHVLGRHELHVKQLGHAQPSLSCAAFANTLSAPPTFKKACSGTLSSSPSTSASNDSTVSETGVKMPGRPLNTSATKNGCDKKRWIFRARDTITLSSSDSSSR